MALDPTLDWRGFDGAGNVEEVTNGFVRYFDLTVPLSLPRTDWVMSLEVGEHLHHAAERMFFRNLHVHNRHGVIISWAGLGQAGVAHINNHDEAYVRARFEEMGYSLDANLTYTLRKSTDLRTPFPGIRFTYKVEPSAVRANILAFRRRTPSVVE